MPDRVLMAEPTAGTRESDADVITRSVTDPEAFALIFERHFDEIHRYLRRRFPEQAEELAADVFVAAFDARARYRPYGDSARPWLYGIASHVLSKRRRREVRSLRAHARSAGGHLFDEADVGTVHRLDAAQQSAVLAAALATLATADRDVLLMYALAELSYDEIAVALDVPIGTVRSRLARARRLCAPMLGGLDD
jgi:RNA polymerase sigma-70 factor (ECF subfamily)